MINKTIPLKSLVKKSYFLLVFFFLSFSSPKIPSSKKSSLKNQIKELASEPELNCRITLELFKSYLTQHLVYKSLTPEIKKRSIDYFIKSLDPLKILFLKADVKKIKKDLKKIFTLMRFSQCGAFQNIQTLLVQRAKENEDYVRELVLGKKKGKKFHLDKNIKIIIDPDLKDYAKSTSERLQGLKSSVHRHFWNYLESGIDKKVAKEKLVHRYELVTKRIKEKTPPEMLTSFMDAATSALDSHSAYLSKDRLEDFQIDMALELEGIGASLTSEHGYTVVTGIIPGGAADKAKVLTINDKIISVSQKNCKNPVSVEDVELQKVVKKIRGPAGTIVCLTILRQVGKTTLQKRVIITRAKINLEEQAAKLTFQEIQRNKKTLKFAVIDLPSFYGDSKTKKRLSHQDMKKLIARANKNSIDGMVLNLYRNGGGLLDEAVKISGLFIRKGPIVATQDTRKRTEYLEDVDEKTHYSGPLVVLTSRGSASASEILAGALKDYKRAIIVGADHTFGKGSIQAVIPFLDGLLGAMKVTTGMFYTPGGSSTQITGVASDIVLPSILSIDKIGEKSLDNPLPPQRISAFYKLKQALSKKEKERWTPVSKKELLFLSQKSQQRVKKNPDFQKVLKELEEIQEREKKQGVIMLSEIIKQKNTEDAKEEEKGKSISERINDRQRPYIQEAVEILADFVYHRAQKNKKEEKKISQI